MNYLGILSLKHGFDQINKIPGGIISVGDHTFSLAKYLHSKLKELKYGTEGNPPLIQFYSKCENIQDQGGICNFNILNSNGSHVGFTGISYIT